MLTLIAAALFADADLCKDKTPGTISFYAEEISRDKPLPPPAQTLSLGKPMYALACLTDAAQKQAQGGKKFRLVLSVQQLNLSEKYSPYAKPKQEGVLRPELSKARKDIIVFIHEDFELSGLKAKLDPGEYAFRLQAASEKGTGQADLTFDLKPDNPTLYVQELRKAGYLADGQVKVVVP